MRENLNKNYLTVQLDICIWSETVIRVKHAHRKQKKQLEKKHSKQSKGHIKQQVERQIKQIVKQWGTQANNRRHYKQVTPGNHSIIEQ